MHCPPKALAFILPFATTILAPSAPAQNQTQKLIASDGQSADMFGMVAMRASRALIGAPLANRPEDSGAAYLFERGPAGWSQTSILQASDAGEYDSFGSQVALSDDLMLVVALSADGQSADAGAVYVFEEDGSGQWTETAKLAALDGFQYDSFGSSIDVWENRVIVGAINVDDSGESSGAAYVFERFGSVWIQTARFTAPDAEEFDRFGSAVAIHGDLAMVSSEGESELAPSAGAVYVFERTETGWVFLEKLLPSTASFLSNFGSSIALDADLAVIGASGSVIAGRIRLARELRSDRPRCGLRRPLRRRGRTK
ncbi:MAG: hypothetical protein ACI841_001084 [Planctomycetota bacterium]|jgi:hypothetical protein